MTCGSFSLGTSSGLFFKLNILRFHNLHECFLFYRAGHLVDPKNMSTLSFRSEKFSHVTHLIICSPLFSLFSFWSPLSLMSDLLDWDPAAFIYCLIFSISFFILLSKKTLQFIFELLYLTLHSTILSKSFFFLHSVWCLWCNIFSNVSEDNN